MQESARRRKTVELGSVSGRRTRVKLTLDLHPIYNNQQALDIALRRMMFKAVATNAQLVEIIPGKGSGKLKHRVLAFLAQHQIRRLYDRVETTEDNTGVVYVHMRRSP